MDLLLSTLQEHIILLNQLGYVVDSSIEDIPKYRRVNIYKDDKVIGDIAYEEKNMFYLFRDNRIVGNRDLSKINFNKRKEKNIRSMVHLRLHDFNLKFNGVKVDLLELIDSLIKKESYLYKKEAGKDERKLSIGIR